MKMSHIIYSSAAALFTAVAVSCTGIAVDIPSEGAGEGLYVSLSTKGNSNDDGTRESIVDHIDIFIFDGQTGNIAYAGGVPCYYHIGLADLEDDGSSTGLLIGGRWQQSPMLSGTDYDVCAIANLHSYDDPLTQELETDLGRVSSLSALIGIIDSDPEIVDGSDTHPDKLFTMYGEKTGWNPQLENPDCVLPLALDRLAAKIRLTVTLADNGSGFIQDNDFSAMTVELRNYADMTPVAPGSSYLPSLKNSSRGDLAVGDGMQVTLYSYPNNWAEDVLAETMLYVNLPYRGQDGMAVNDNWYRIPVCPVGKGYGIESNTFYDIRARIGMAGSQESHDPVLLEDIDFEVAPWSTTGIPVNDENPSYLILNEYEVIMRGTDRYADLTFTSSSPVSVSVEDAYFIDKDGAVRHLSAQEMEEESISAIPDAGLSGAITISSREPLNKTVRYISLKVTNAQGGSADVAVIQYPLEYITGIPGLYSYLESYGRDWPSGFSSIHDTGTPVPQEIRDGLDGHIGDGVDMKSKFYLEADRMIYRVDYSYDSKNDVNYCRDAGSATNNRMYHLTITATSGDYTLARPIMDSDDPEVADADDSQNNSLVSPSFMIASQLGNNSTMSWSAAQTLCKEYVEAGSSVDGDGNRKLYDDWRLPTAAEIQIIMRYQEDEHVKGITMDNILQSELEPDDEANQTHYWTAVRNVYMDTLQPDTVPPAVESSDEARVRCVRNYSPGDPEE